MVGGGHQLIRICFICCAVNDIETFQFLKNILFIDNFLLQTLRTPRVPVGGYYPPPIWRWPVGKRNSAADEIVDEENVV